MHFVSHSCCFKVRCDLRLCAVCVSSEVNLVLWSVAFLDHTQLSIFIYAFYVYGWFFCMCIRKRHQIPWASYRWLGATMWALGNELKTFGKAATALNFWATTTLFELRSQPNLDSPIQDLTSPLACVLQWSTYMPSTRNNLCLAFYLRIFGVLRQGFSV